MLKLLSFILFLIICPDSHAKNSLMMAKAPGALGEPGHDYLFGQGLFMQAFYNDVLGQTDKFLTNGSRVGLIASLGKFSFELTGSWRFVTPAIKDNNFSEYNLENPPGIFADWMSASLAIARPIKLSRYSYFLWQISGGYDHFGDKAARDVQQTVHRVLGIDYKIYDYESQVESEIHSLGAEFGYVRKLTKYFHSKSSLGYSSNLLVNTGYFDQYFLYNRFKSFKFSFSYKYLYQFESNAGLLLKPERNEYSLSFLFFDFYKPAVRYVSSYVEGDTTRQIMTDFLSFQLLF